VVGYATKFKYLSEFCAPAGEKEWKCRRFEEGLRHELKRIIIPLDIIVFHLLVEKSKTKEY